MDRRSSARSGGSREHLVGEYLERVAAHDVVGARTLVLTELAPDEGLSTLIVELLAPAMAEVGDRWYGGRWSASQEHVASGITESALSAASVRTRSRRPAPDAPTAVLVCPRGEEHVLPARFAGELLVEAGADVITLGLPVPDQDLADFLVEVRPSALVVSCTEPLAIPGVRAAVAAAHKAGVPALVGGAGLGEDGRRAAALGADGWALRSDDVIPVLRAWRERPPELARVRPESPEVAALQDLQGSGDGLGVETERGRALVDVVLRALASALLGDDERLFTDKVTWIRGLFETRGTPLTVLDDAFSAADDALGDRDVPQARRLLASA
jgi:methanogenic corrinoid protein MtbC1